MQVKNEKRGGKGGALCGRTPPDEIDLINGLEDPLLLRLGLGLRELLLSRCRGREHEQGDEEGEEAEAAREHEAAAGR